MQKIDWDSAPDTKKLSYDELEREACDLWAKNIDLQGEIEELHELVRDMYADYVEFAGNEGCAYWPRETFGARFVELGLDVPLHEWERYELKYEKKQLQDCRPMHDALEKCGLSVEVD